MRKTIYLLALLLVIGSASVCYSAEKLTDAKRNDIQKLLDMTVTDAFIEAYMGAFMQMFAEVASMEKSEDEKEVIQKITDIVRDEIIAEFPQLITNMVPLYAEYYSHEDIKQLIKFYESPAGKRTIEVTPALTVRGAEIGREWGTSIGPRIEQRMREEGLIE